MPNTNIDNDGFNGCPFCGEKPWIETLDEDEYADEYRFHASCIGKDCPVNLFAFASTLEELKEKWNRRA